jgi:hypothetical protein
VLNSAVLGEEFLEGAREVIVKGEQARDFLRQPIFKEHYVSRLNDLFLSWLKLDTADVQGMQVLHTRARALAELVNELHSMVGKADQTMQSLREREEEERLKEENNARRDRAGTLGRS